MTTLIKNVQLFRGDGSGAERKDVLVSGQKISAIGSFSDRIAADIYDGQGAYLSPGWIDFHNEADHQALSIKNMHHSEILKQGVTTVVGGHDGVSLAPASINSLRYFRNWGGEAHGINWKSFSQFLSFWDKSHLAVNFGSLVGYSSLRAMICGGHYAPCSGQKMNTLLVLLKDSLISGAAGLSVDLHLGHNSGQFLREIEKVAKVLNEKNKILVLDISPNSFAIRKDLLLWLKNIPCRIVVNNIMAMGGKEDALLKELFRLDNVYLEYPMGAQDLPIFRFMPEWFLQNPELNWKSLQDPWIKNRVLKDMPAVSGKDTRIVRTRHSPALVGLTISEYAKHCDFKDTKEALLYLASSTYGQTAISKAPRRSYPHWLGSPKVVFSGQSARVAIESREHPGLWHGDRQPAEFMATLINSKVLSMSEAISKMTYLPAKLLNMAGQGMVQEGFSANFTLFEVQPGPRRKDKILIKAVFVNGKLAWEKDSGVVNSKLGIAVKSN